MSDQPSKPRSISQISHLFLSSVRDKQTAGAPKPVRLPPGAKPPVNEPVAPELDLTAEEYAQVNGVDSSGSVRVPPITAVIAHHLNGGASERVNEYARHLAANGQRIGLLQIDGSDIRISSFERSIQPTPADVESSDETMGFDARAVTDALHEMSCDVDRWLLVLPGSRSPEARALLASIENWVMLSTVDHDGVVSCYRALKGLAGVGQPRISLAVIQATSESQAAKVFKKLQNVCLQFLGIEMQSEPLVRATQSVAQSAVTHYQNNCDETAVEHSAHWLLLTDFVAQANSQSAEDSLVEHDTEMPESEPVTAPIATVSSVVAEPTPVAMKITTAPADDRLQSESPAELSEVIDLPGDIADESAIIQAILSHAKNQMIQCPIVPPMCAEARLAVTHDRGLVLLAVAKKGLKDLNAIAAAYRWLNENRPLIAMALPQIAIDAHRLPRLTLLVNHADMSADVLATMLASGTVTVQSYRKLRWGGRTGLLLEAA